MSCVLVIEPDSGRADTLRDLLTTRANTDVVVVASKDAAVASVDERVPDLVLVDPLMSPRDEDSLIGHFRTLPDAGHLQTLTIPQLGRPPRQNRTVRSVFGRRKRQATEDASAGYAPTQFVSEVAAYLARACELKGEIEQEKAASAERREAWAAEVDRAHAEAQQVDEERTLASSADVTEPSSAESVFLPVSASDALASELERARVDAARVLAHELGLAEERHRAEVVRLAAETVQKTETAARDAQTTAQALGAEVERLREEAKRTRTTELASVEERHRVDIARLEEEAADREDAAAREALKTAEARSTQALVAEVNRVRAEAEESLAAQLAEAEERRRADIARVETEAAQRTTAAAREAAATADALEQTRRDSAEVERARVESEQALAMELAAAEARHEAAIVRLEAAAEERADAAAREALAAAEAQSAAALAAEVERVRTEAEAALATRLADAEDRRRADIVRLEAEASARSAAAERTVAEQLAAAEERHQAEIARFEAEAAETSNAASREARAQAEAAAREEIAAERDQVRQVAERTLAAALEAAQERHRDEIFVLGEEAAARSDAATEVAQARADETLAAVDERHRADIARLEADAAKRTNAAPPKPPSDGEAETGQMLAAELERLRAEAGQVLEAELAAAEARSRAEVLRVKEETQQTLTARLQQVQSEANRAQAEVARLVDASRHSTQPGSVSPARESIGLAPRARTPLAHEDGSVGGDDYYRLWQARFNGRTEEDAPAAEESPRKPGRARRRWALMVAAILVVLLTPDPARQSAVGQALAAGAAGVSHVIGSPGQARSTGAATAPNGLFDIEGVPSGGEAPRSTSQVTIEAVGFLLGVLFLLVILFIGEGVVWHGLVVIFGVVLLVFAVMRPPPPIGTQAPTPETVAVADETGAGG
jgi:hypothetical protein